MTRTLRYLLLAVLVGLSASTFAQEIGGKVIDEKKEGVINAAVQVYQGGVLKGGTITDFNGEYVVKPLDPGTYDVLVMYLSYDTAKKVGVIVNPGNRTTVDFQMEKPKSTELKTTVITSYKVPLVNHDNKSVVITKDKIDVMPTTQVADVVSTSTNVYQSQRGASVQIGGARVEGTEYIVDGIVVQGGSADMAQGSIDQIEVLSSGVPANYGDFSGGVVNITSRSVTQKLTGNVRVQHSIDGYNNNLATFSLAGPLYKKNMGEGKPRKPVLGFTLSGDYYDDHDRYPYYNEEYVANGNVLKNLQANPLRITTDNGGLPVYNYASDYVTLSGLHQVKIPPKDEIKEYRLNGKLDYQINDNMRIMGGGSFDYTSSDAYSRARTMFAPDATPVSNTLVGRAYLRFTQKFGKMGDTSNRHSVISNAFYKIQADYQKTNFKQHDPNFKENFFDYAYVGKFTETRKDLYFTGAQDSLTKKFGTVLQLSEPTGITYTPDPLNRNPTLENYTKQYYNFYNSYSPDQPPLFITQVQAANAMANGDEPKFTYDLFYSPGATQSAYGRSNSNQYSLDVSASFDLLIGKVRHAIEFGLYYQQRVEIGFTGLPNPNGEGTASIWQLMRQLVSNIDNGNLKLDRQHPIFKINGQDYNFVPDGSGVTGHGYFTDKSGNIKNVTPGPNDTITYNYINIGNSTFDQNLRKKLGISSTADINIDALDPSTFSLNMFSADELLNNGQRFTYYYGYTYTGQAQTGNVNFNDFWTKKDANGNYTRPIGAFSPNYTAGYILDKFQYKDVHFNVGVRIDRYSYNQKVLDDPYSLYQEKTVAQVSGSENLINGGKHPGNMGGNFVVYVDDNTSSSPNIIGYRSGNNWYDATGKFINDPSVLKQYSGGRDPQPFIVKDAAGNLPNIQDSNFNPNSSFTDYTPQVVVEPRVQFSFPVSDVADFYAHYDIYAQRPTSNIQTDPSVYYFLQQNANQIVNNPNLKPQRTFDYEAGFQQKLSERSALTLNAFYKERKDFITVVPYLYAWPTTYYTYGNRDFTTTKGTALRYDLRATNHLTMTVAYTLQFAEGTGSNPNSTNRNGGGQISPNGLLQSFIEAGLPNLRYISPLDIDSRHNIVADLDYRFKPGEGPLVSGKRILQSAGVHLIGKARSGEPYTRYVAAQGSTVIGGVGGSRLPWHYGLDMRIDKDFAVNNLKKQNVPEGVKPKRPLFVRAILQLNNVLNTRDVLHVYGYTGKPDDNGYLASSYGQQFVPQQINPQSYADLYRIATNSPGNLNYARTISFALEFNF